ncbi:AmmeMemoRadiSam system protein B [Tundrisphaera lichenicola]|uniref:AmmeMemoRadiSam system protein B n=1 Tax=Tundrisphaera lichenicola TaxID=2029860 RepID=UPI003EBA5EB3
MDVFDRPRLRPLSARRVDKFGESFVVLEDPMDLAPGPISIPLDCYLRFIRRFDGSSNLDEIASRVYRETGQRTSTQDLLGLVESLDRAMLLDGPNFAAYRRTYAEQVVRFSAHDGHSYAADPATLRAQLTRIFQHPDAAGLPSQRVEDGPGRLRGILCPHIDFGRGGSVYTWAYRELIERSGADIFVILGVAHQPCRHRFALTRKDFQTPLGLVPTNRELVDRIAETAGSHFFEDELAHRTEHSIEFQAVFLRFLLGDRRDFTIVPILVGSFHDLMESGSEPMDDPEVARMIEALRLVGASPARRVVFVGAIDLCHVGPEFGDRGPVDDSTLASVESFDRMMLDHATRLDAPGWFRKAAAIGNRWRVCGLAATYTMLQAIGPCRGRFLRYEQSIDPARTCCVSFASVAYDDEV